ncbi:TPA: transposase [Pseudomonas aeruginosa]|nr:transposase [Pseudomonas aeruginosa]
MANRRLSKEIRTIHHEVNGIYGHRRIKAELAAMGHACGRHRAARLMREAGFQQSSRSADCAESPGSPVRLGSRQPALGLGHDLRADGPRLAVSGRRARSLFTRRRRLGDAPPHAAGFGTRRAGDGRCTPTAERRGAAALGSWQPILCIRLPGLTSATSNRAQPFTSGELLGQRSDGELLPFAEDRAGVPDALRQLPGGENRPVRLHPLLQSPPSPLDVGLHQSNGV